MSSGDEIWDSADERKKKKPVLRIKRPFLGGRKYGPKSPDYEDQKFEIAICKNIWFGGFLHVA
jgi:hypothetical protein